MLMKNERKLLHFLRTHEPDQRREVYSYAYLEESFPNSTEDMYAAVRSLASSPEKFIGYAIKESTGKYGGIYLETNGRRYREFIFWQIFFKVSRFLCGLLVGIVIGAFGTLIAEYLVRQLFQ